MHSMELLEKLDEILEKEIKEVVEKGKVEATQWDNLEKVVDIMEKSKKVQKMLCEMEDDEYDYEYSSRSYDTPFMPRMTRTRGRSKTTGRYMSRSHGGDYGRSNHSIRDRAVDAIERMYDEASTDHERQVLDNMIRMIENSEK